MNQQTTLDKLDKQVREDKEGIDLVKQNISGAEAFELAPSHKSSIVTSMYDGMIG